MKLSQIEQLLEVAHAGSISQAAINLYMTQPSLSQSIRKIEEEIGVPLFNRTNTGVELTPFGRRIVNHAEDVMLQMNLLDAACVLQAQARPMGLSIVSGGYYFITQQLLELYKKYSSNPIMITCHESCSLDQIKEMIQTGQAELSFVGLWEFEKRTALRRMASEGIEYHYLTDAVPGVYVGRSNPLWDKDLVYVTAEDLRNLPYVTVRNDDAHMEGIFKRLFPRENTSGIFCATRTLIMNNTGAMRDAISITGGFSLGIYCGSIYERTKFYDDLRFIPFENGIMSCEIGWYQKSNATRSVLANELISLLQQNVL